MLFIKIAVEYIDLKSSDPETHPTGIRGGPEGGPRLFKTSHKI